MFITSPLPSEIHPLSLHDALPICKGNPVLVILDTVGREPRIEVPLYGLDEAYNPSWSPDGTRIVFSALNGDRKSTRLNSSHLVISYAVFCLKKKITKEIFYNNYTK